MKRKKSGRGPIPGGRSKFTTTLPAYVVRHLRKDGNASAKIIGYVDIEINEKKGKEE